MRTITGLTRIDHRGDDEKGAILVVVLWVILAISVLAVSFSASIRTEVDAARNVVEQKQCFYMARAGVEYAVYQILLSQSAFAGAQQALNQEQDPESTSPVQTGNLSLVLGGGKADVELIEESGKININFAPDHLIFNLLIMVGVPEADADIITDSIGDWKDPDDFARPFGAEAEYYMSLDPPYFPKNGPFSAPEELLMVQGVTPLIFYGKKGLSDTGEPVEYYGLQKYFTTFTSGRESRINIKSAPIPVLAAIPGLDYATAIMIDEIRSEMPIQNPAEIAQLIPGISTEALGLLSVNESKVFTINSIGSLSHSEVVSRIRAVVRVDGTGQKGYAVLYWNEANLEL
jgi:general secretion pathway protein K